MRNHLRVHHVLEYCALEKQQKAVVAEKKASQCKDCTTGKGREANLKQTTLQLPLPHSSCSKFDKSHPKQQLITERIALMICKDMQPYSIVDDVGFRSVLEAAEPRYVLPS